MQLRVGDTTDMGHQERSSLHVEFGVLIGHPSRNVELEADYPSVRFRKGN